MGESKRSEWAPVSVKILTELGEYWVPGFVSVRRPGLSVTCHGVGWGVTHVPSGTLVGGMFERWAIAERAVREACAGVDFNISRIDLLYDPPKEVVEAIADLSVWCEAESWMYTHCRELYPDRKAKCSA